MAVKIKHINKPITIAIIIPGLDFSEDGLVDVSDLLVNIIFGEREVGSKVGRKVWGKVGGKVGVKIDSNTDGFVVIMIVVGSSACLLEAVLVGLSVDRILDPGVGMNVGFEKGVSIGIFEMVITVGIFDGAVAMIILIGAFEGILEGCVLGI